MAPGSGAFTAASLARQVAALQRVSYPRGAGDTSGSVGILR